MRVLGNNFLQEYLTNRAQYTDSAGGWLNETSVFENKSGTSLEDLFRGRNAKANARIISRHEIGEAMNRSDREEYFDRLIRGFLNRQYIFDTDVDISSVLRRYNSGLTYTDSFKEILGSDNPYVQKDVTRQMVPVNPDLSVTMEPEKYPVAPLPIEKQVPGYEDSQVGSTSMNTPVFHEREDSFYYPLQRIVDDSSLNRDMQVGECETPVKITEQGEVAPDLVFEQDLQQELPNMGRAFMIILQERARK